MSSHSRRLQRIDPGGEQVVVLTRHEYDRLEASRRQVGAQHKRLRAMRQRLDRRDVLLADAALVLASAEVHSCPEADQAVSHTDVTCRGCRLLAAIRDDTRPVP
ncbi:hypothetical protein GCM10010211_57800 [Streptomyces albospinus]|uniref:Uncharacterized protein n=1 Tax=Streptomyces albospinus TaxID=285515 RepID=A0ABQ2VFR5_9ACTN|nr:hypothetical protein [Streptomyces albospinus]GGU84311.1 hypothetical protein GCM10010211_57800 [Streptomyces albospinus]